MASPRVYADFQNLDDANRVRLSCAGTQRDLERQGIELRKGTTLTLYGDDANDEGQPDELLADAVVHYNHPRRQAEVRAHPGLSLAGFLGGANDVPSVDVTDARKSSTTVRRVPISL